jgi:formate dehydrogenase subunit delta
MDAEHLVEMVNDISNFFAPANPPAQAATEVAGHLRRTWDPRMRRAIVALQSHEDLSDVGRAAVALLAADQSAVK